MKSMVPQPDATPAPAQSQGHTMQCMEVWGSNRAVSSGVVMPGLDAWVYSRPAEDDDQGGDVHYVSACATGRVIRALVADVSGHGAGVGEVSSDLRALMRKYINFVDQRRFLRELNGRFRGLDESGHFATAVVVTCWTPTDELTISLAGHPAPARFDSAAGEWSIVSLKGAADIPLGVDKAAAYGEARVRLRRDDLVLLYTDGLIEARDPQGNQLGLEGLLGLLASLDGSDPAALVDALLERLDAFRGGPAPDDDLTMLLLRPNEQKPRASLMTGVVAVKRIASSVMDSALGRGPASLPEMNRTNALGAFSDRFNRPRDDA